MIEQELESLMRQKAEQARVYEQKLLEKDRQIQEM